MIVNKMSGSDDNEHDYMSDNFLVDLRPGLQSNSARRKGKANEIKKGPPQQKKAKVLEEEARSKGLSEPLSSDNKGFAMLQKMGYKAGTSLGKSGGTGEKTPIPIIMKDGKSGLGRKGFLTQKRLEQKSHEASQYVDFRHRKRSELALVLTQSDLKKSKMACHQLDVNVGLSHPTVDWYWPEELLSDFTKEEVGLAREDKHDSDEGGSDVVAEGCDGGVLKDPDDKQGFKDEICLNTEEDEEYTLSEPSDQLEELTSYLRGNHFYCIWCGTAYTDDADLSNHCPGNNRQAHDDY